MFTGIIEEVGTVKLVKGSANGARKLFIGCGKVLAFENRRQSCREWSMPDDC